VARAKKTKQVDDYRHDRAKRLNNPPAALAREDLSEVPSRKFDYDPHLPPELWWAGKDHAAALEVEAPSIHIHERLSAEAIMRAAQREEPQLDLFGDPGFDRSKAIEFYEHEMDWVNRLILGDSLVVMTSLLERERLGGQVQMIYIDPPYGINYKSNFQPSIRSTDVKDNDAGFSREPEQIQAYRDTWELGVHSYLSYLRSRLVIARDLLADSGSLFVQIGDDYCHLVRTVVDEVFGPSECIAQIAMQKSGSATSTTLPRILDHVLWYAKDRSKLKYREVYQPFDLRNLDTYNYKFVEDPEGNRREMTPEEKRNPASIDPTLRPFQTVTITSQDPSSTRSGPFEWEGSTYWPDKDRGRKRHWSVAVPDGLERLAELDRLVPAGHTLRVRRYLDDFPVELLRNVWLDTGRSGYGDRQRYVVQTNPKAIERCMLMTTDPGDLVIDPTSGSGTTAWVAEKHGRRWITTDTSRVALAITRERLLSARFDYYLPLDEERGVDGGFQYETVQRIQPSDLASDKDIPQLPLRTNPRKDASKVRVSGPFTVEGLSRYSTDPLSAASQESASAESAADHVEVLLDALRTQGIPRQNGKPAEVISLAPLSGDGILHAEGVYRDSDDSERPFAVSLGPRHGQITQIQVDNALAETPGYRLIVFAGFAATPEAQEYLAPGKRGRVQVALLEANPDLLLGDLLKQTKASQTFRLFSAPDVELRPVDDGELVVEVRGMDSFDAATGDTTSRGTDGIAAWLLDTDYDASVFHANQAFFTASTAWDALAKALCETVDEDSIAKLHSFESLPFKRPDSGKVAVRVIDDAGSTSERVLEVPEP
jgi:adenine-specific DNA-methyltransferase